MGTKPDLVLHMGHPKTGSTAIQQTLASAHIHLSENGILYPETSIIHHNHRVLVPAIFQDKFLNGLALRMGPTPGEVQKKSEQEWNLVREQIYKFKPQRIIISAEDFFHTLDHQSSILFQENIAKLNTNRLSLFAYIRSPSSFYLSRVQQRLRGGLGLEPPSSLCRLDTIKSFEQRLNVQLILRPFQKSQLYKNDVVADFAEWLGIPTLSDQYNVGRVNESISAEAMSVLSNIGPKKPPSTRDELIIHREFVKIVRSVDQEIPNPTRPKLHEHMVAYVNSLNKDFFLLYEFYGLYFDDFEYNFFRNKRELSKININNVEDICDVNVKRRFLIENTVKHRLGKLLA